MNTLWYEFSAAEIHGLSWLKARRLIALLGTISMAIAGGLLIAPVNTARAQVADDSNFSAPILDKKTASYYELVEFPGDGSGTWDEAKALAEDRAYLGRKGRLAVVKDRDTNLFFAKNFGTKIPTKEIWVGLTYHCDSHQLIWEDGTVFEPGEYSNWDKQWYWDYSITCQYNSENRPDGHSYMTVFYKSYEDGFTWQASGANKVFDYFVVEYPAPESKKKTVSAAEPVLDKPAGGPGPETASNQ